MKVGLLYDAELCVALCHLRHNCVTLHHNCVNIVSPDVKIVLHCFNFCHNCVTLYHLCHNCVVSHHVVSLYSIVNW